MKFLRGDSESLRWLIFIIFGIISINSCRVSTTGTLHRQRTLGMIKPDGVYGNYTNEVKRIIEDSGFSMVRELRIQLDEDTAKRFYAEHSSKSFFPSLVKYMTSGPVFIMVLEKENAVADWRNLIGPTNAETAKVSHPHSIRAICGVDSEKNCIHGSDSVESAEREIRFFFGPQVGRDEKLHDEL